MTLHGETFTLYHTSICNEIYHHAASAHALSLSPCLSLDKLTLVFLITEITTDNDILAWFYFFSRQHFRLEIVSSGSIRAVGQLGGSAVKKVETVRGALRQWRRLSLVLENHSTLKELKGLGTVHTLTVRKCPSIIDAATLGNVHTLVLDSCEKLRDVSALSSCIDVTLANLQRVLDVRALASCTRVSLVSCQGVTDVSSLSGVTEVSLSKCHSVTSLALAGCRRVFVSACEGIQDLTGLVSASMDRCVCA